MSQRYPPPRDRDRSPPPRQFDRRSSTTYTPLPASQSYRPGDSGSSLERPAPRGPRADSFRGTPRGRGTGFATRGGDSWDRDRERDRDRDSRALSATFRRDDDRSEWTRRGDDRPGFNRDRPPYVGRDVRERSASPIRQRRDSKDSTGLPFNRPADTGSSYLPGSVRGGADRGRGRGGWDRSRGRTSFIGERERELFPNRSRSRDGWREREREVDRGRNFGNEPDRFDRRDLDRTTDREPRNREHDIWQRDPSPGRGIIINRIPSPGALSSISQDRPAKLGFDRKPSTSITIQQLRDERRENQSDQFVPRKEPLRRDPTLPSAQAPPAFQSMTSTGLDYGDDPVSFSVDPPVAVDHKTHQTKADAPRPRPAPPAPPAQTTLPPSAPKAERSTVSTNLVPTAEYNSRSDPISRSERAPLQETIPRQSPEISKVPTAPQATRLPPQSTLLDRPLPSNIPSGPRLGAPAPYIPRTSPVVQQSVLPSAPARHITNLDTRPIPNAPTGPKNASIIAPSGPRVVVPTGPANAQNVAPSSISWSRPKTSIDHPPTKPSIMSAMKPHPPNRPSILGGQKRSPIPINARMVEPARSPITSSHLMPMKTDQYSDDQKQRDADMSNAASEDEDDDESPDSELDELDLANSEEKHQKDMQILRSKLPAPILQNNHIVSRLIRLQFLFMIAEGQVPAEIQLSADSRDITMLDHAEERFISPDQTPPEDQLPILEHPKPRGRPLKESPINPIPTPPLDDLPYDRDDDFEERFREFAIDEVENEKLTDMLRNQFEKDVWSEKEDLQELEEFYKRKYPEWKYEIDRYEQMRRDLEATPDPGSPGGQSVASIPQSVERPIGRAIRNATEFDMEKALLLSQQSAREEEEKREREAASNARPNYDVEAEVPAMLKPADREPCWSFQDTNTFVPTDRAVHLMQYIPPEDDFTAEEQADFIKAFCQTPKRWGIIADHVPGRSYQECIIHYYLTKNEANYKEHWRRSQPKRKRGRAATRPRSTALLADMPMNDDPDSTPAPVTDSGRPKRAAAPTFGDLPEGEPSTLPAAKRQQVTTKEGIDPAAKTDKSRKGAKGTKVRRTKAQILADQQAAAIAAGVDPATLKTAPGKTRTLAAAKPEPVISQHVPRQPDFDLSNISPPATSGPMRQRTPPLPQVTSYWSVPEQQKFRQLVGYYGRDYVRIADFMKTKSQAMIKNYYSREVQRGDLEIERMAQIAEDKINRGQPLGTLPSPIVPPKRKYDTPSLSSRPLGGPDSVDPDRSPLPSRASHVEDFPSNTIHRDASGSLVTKSSPRTDLLHHSPLHLPVQAKVEEFGRDRSLGPQKVTLGPQRGMFDEPYIHNRQARVRDDPILQHHPPHVVDLRGGGELRDSRLQMRDQQSQQSSSMRSQWQQQMEADRAILMARERSRTSGLAHATTTAVDQRVAELSAMQNEPPRFSGQSPHVTTQQTAIPRHEPYNLYPVHHQMQSHQSQQQQSVPVKQEAPKPPTKRSNVFGLLNDDPPDKPLKRSSTDSTSRMVATPPLQPVAPQPQPFQSRLHEEMHARQSGYGTAPPQNNHRNINDLRSAYSNSPMPSPRQDWLDKFDPRNSAADRSANHSPLYSVIPPTSSALSRPPITEPLRALDSSQRRPPIGRSGIPSPPRQNSPVPSFRPSSAAPQHNRMSSIGVDPRSQIPYHQPTSASATPISSLHRREPSTDYRSNRPMTIQEFKAASDRDPRDLDRLNRDDILRHADSRPDLRDRDRDIRDIYRAERIVPSTQPGGFGYQAPTRTFTPPGFDPRMQHNQHAHQQHHGISVHQQGQQVMSHHHQQGLHGYRHEQTQQQQPRYGVPPSSLAPPSGHFRAFSDDRR